MKSSVNLRCQGIGVVVISDDLPELLATCGRILVMKDGRIDSTVNAGEMNEIELGGKVGIMNITSLKALATKNETLVAVVIIAFCILATFSDPLFLSVTTLTDLMSSVVIGILAVAAMMVLISGGIDVSFTAIAVFAMYSTTVFTLAVMRTCRGTSFAISIELARSLGRSTVSLW